MNEQRVLAVTGASSGIGAALALRAARIGYAVIATGRNSEALATLNERVKHEGGSITTLIGDVRSSSTSQQIATTALEIYGRLDVVVANAGIAGRGPLALQSDEELREQFETHVFAPLTLIRACLPLLTVTKGATFVLGSGVARMPIGGMGLYPASKAALRSAARTLRTELKPLGIGLTYVDPGAVDTEFMHRQSMPGAPRFLLVSPHVVAQHILSAIQRRPAALNVVGWQSSLLGIAELFPRLTDAVLARAGTITGAPIVNLSLSGNDAIKQRAPLPQAQASDTEKIIAEDSGKDLLSTTIAPFLVRMRRLNFPPDMLRTRFAQGQTFSEDELALDWVGMPNKNERKLITDLCGACALAGLLEASGERQWHVL